ATGTFPWPRRGCGRDDEDWRPAMTTSPMERRFSVSRLFLIAAIGVLPASAQATTYYVDGACPSEGNGTSLTCGTNGPFTTINRGISPLAPGDTLNIRGAHGSFDGTTNESLGIWGPPSDAFPGPALNCPAASPCVIQGCPASACGADETPIVRGMVRRTDWTDEGGGVWSRAMEAESPANYATVETARDNFDPSMIMQGTANPFTMLQHARANALAPTEGHWSYNTSSHRIYINPVGTGDPRSAISIMVPNKQHMMDVKQGNSGTDCPSTSCPMSNHVTFRRLTFEGTRW